MNSRPTETSEPIPGKHTSIWLDTTAETSYDELDGSDSVDTVVLGGGIVGITAAYHLTNAGQEVAVVERNRIVTGTTGHTTAKLTSLHGLRYSMLVDRLGEQPAHQYGRANEHAIDDVESIVERHDIDCDFERVKAVTYVSDRQQTQRIQDEVRAARRLGLPASYSESAELPLDVEAAVEFDEQAHFHPRKYLLALAGEVDDTGGTIYEQTKAIDVTEQRGFQVETENGTIDAENVVIATHFPIVDKWLFFSRMHPKRSYVLAVTLDDSVPDAMYYRPGNPYFSVRPEPTGDGATVLVGGQNHRTGHGGDSTERYRTLERQARERFDVESVDYRWSTQDFVSIDGVPFVGVHKPFGENAYVATGFGGWGMTNGVAAGRIIADSILDRGSPWEEVFRTSRLTIDGTLREFVSHNTKSARHLFEDYLRTREPAAVDQLARDEAQVVDSSDGPVGLYRDEDGEIHAVSAVCTHMNCVVNWNDAEKSWDCPCHGSRFDVDGTVIDTPALADLDQYRSDQFTGIDRMGLESKPK